MAEVRLRPDVRSGASRQPGCRKSSGGRAWTSTHSTSATRRTWRGSTRSCGRNKPSAAHAGTGPAAIVAADPPQLVRGDLEDVLPSLIAQAPVDAALVVFHSSVLYQVPPDRRAAFVDFMRRLDRAHWVAIEAPDVLPHADLPPPPDHTALTVLALDQVPLAWTRGHGQGLVWFGPDIDELAPVAASQP